MIAPLQFETPENVQIQYEPAGLGTRFLAWLIDQCLLVVLMILMFIILIVAAISLDGVFASLDTDLESAPESVLMYFAGLMALIWGLGSFLYFGLSELLDRGQTIGKRVMRIRVVKADGFALDPASILVRNLFRVADHLPPMWIIPLLSNSSQRAGDMVGGTVVISDDPASLTTVRSELAERSAADAEFRFDRAALSRLTPSDVEAVERILDRWDALPDLQRNALLDKMIGPLAKRLQVEPPPQTPIDKRFRFLEDLLAAELRRQSRALG